MKWMINITDYHDDLNRYRDAQELADMLKKYGLNGLEVMPSAEKPVYPFLEGQVIGVHMRCQPDWLDFWKQDTDTLNREYGEPGVWEAVFQGTGREALLARAREDLEYALLHHAEYVVFHISNVRTTDILTYRFDYTDEEVVDASADLINELLADYADAPFYFLMENLWWPGLRMTDPALTRRLLDRVHYCKKGIMLDVGHFLHTDNRLRTQAEGVDYVMAMLAQHREMLPYIKGIHLHQSMSGKYVEDYLQNPAEVPSGYSDRFIKAMYHVLAIDGHEPFTDAGVKDIITAAAPDFVTLEFISKSREEHEEKIREQMRAISRN